MQHQPIFLERLGLAPDADERQVRRAYARELKQIDQERDLEGFQHLRACYEAALEWAAHRAAPAFEQEAMPDAAPPAPAEQAPMDVAVPPQAHMPPAPGYQQRRQAPPPALQQQRETVPPPPAQQNLPPPPQQQRTPPPPQRQPSFQPPADDTAPSPPSPQALGGAVFAAFCERFGALAALSERVAPGEAGSAMPWTVALRDALSDQRLLNLDARHVFEHRLATLLAEGWRPGHHLLLDAAADTLGWGSDRGALKRLGHPGAVLDAALEQRETFEAQSPQVRAQQREVLAMLRAPNPPVARLVRPHIRVLRLLQARFPVLLHVLAPQAAVAAWHRLFPEARPEPVPEAPPPPSRQILNVPTGGAIAFFVMIGLAAFHFASDWNRPPAGFYPPGASASASRPLSQERRDRIGKAIQYEPGPHVLPGTQYAQVRVSVDGKGEVVDMVPVNLGADPAFVRAVMKAIVSSGPFPPEAGSSFVLEYTVDVKPSGRTAQGGAAGEQRAPLSKALLAKIEKHVKYQPGKDVAPGELTVKLKVRLDGQGAVDGIERLETAGDPKFAAALERAVHAAAPYPPDTPRTFSIGYRGKITSRRAPAPPPDTPNDGE